MATHSNNFIRVRLHFDYPPPAVVDCRMCWLLVDLNTCRVVADVESVIREKFEFSRRSILNLFIEDCYLPHTESVYVVRDNDSLRVKVDCLAQVTGHSSSDTASENCRKRPRPSEEDGPAENGLSVECKKKRSKKRSKVSLERDTKQASGDERTKKSPEKPTKKKKRKKAVENGPTVTPKPVASPQKKPVSVEKPVKSTKKSPVVQAKTQTVSSSDSSSSSSDEDEAPKKPAAQKAAPKTPSSTPAVAKPPPTTKRDHIKPHPPWPSSSESGSSSDEASTVKSLPKTNGLTFATPKGRLGDNSTSQQALPALQPVNGTQKQAARVAVAPKDKMEVSSSSDSEEEIKLVIRRPVQQPGRNLGSQPSWRGRGQTSNGGPGQNERGRGRGVGRGHSASFEFRYNGATEPSCHTDSLTNMSVVLQNAAEAAPKRDYSSMPLLAAPPQVGQKIAFKLLELTENYTPEVSEYKEGRIVSFDLTTKQIELQLLNAYQAPVEPGKFDLVYQNADGSESVEYAVSRGSRVTERWDSLLEPRLII
ncbi:coilin [Etheostoma spectabile]|uniref:coilin n=1 Tax=Etheostoma spectabile TaxID=54343 RepID=UPI0013AEEA56|nr:coilin [Etheostoma spectabile]